MTPAQPSSPTQPGAPVNRVIPTEPVVPDSSGANYRTQPSVGGSRFTSPKPALTGTGAPGQTVNVVVSGISIGSTTADHNGMWKFSPELPLAHGLHTVRVDYSNSDGSQASSDEVEFGVILHKPAAPVITSLPRSGSVPADTLVFAGTAVPGAELIVRLGDRTWKTSADSDGNWSIDPGLLAEGTYRDLTVEAIPPSDLYGSKVLGLISHAHAFTVGPVSDNAETVGLPRAGREGADGLQTSAGSATAAKPAPGRRSGAQQQVAPRQRVEPGPSDPEIPSPNRQVLANRQCWLHRQYWLHRHLLRRRRERCLRCRRGGRQRWHRFG